MADKPHRPKHKPIHIRVHILYQKDTPKSQILDLRFFLQSNFKLFQRFLQFKLESTQPCLPQNMQFPGALRQIYIVCVDLK